MFRVYLDLRPLHDGYREFGIDYLTREAAERAADLFRANFPHNRYIVR